MVMGVSGCGKSTIGQLLAKVVSLPFYDADLFHPEENIAKMRKGLPLTDEDRIPWLMKLSDILKEEGLKKGCVLACSALKESYRVLLQNQTPEKIIWIHLEGSREILKDRLKNRSGHFLDDRLLASQLETLEKPSYALHIPVTFAPEKIIEMILENIKAR